MPPSPTPRPVAELLNEPIPEKLWHYPSIEGFYRIVTSKRIWATDLRFLNDSEEFIHMRRIADNIISEEAQFDSDGFEKRELLAKATVLAFDGGPMRVAEVFVPFSRLVVGAKVFERSTSWSRTREAKNLKPCGCRTYKPRDLKTLPLFGTHGPRNAERR